MTKTESTSSSRTLFALLGVIVVVLIIAFSFMAFRSETPNLLPGGQNAESSVTFVCPDESMYIVQQSGTSIEVAGTAYALDAVTNQYQSETSPVTFALDGSELTVFSGGEVVTTCVAGTGSATADTTPEDETVSEEDTVE